MGPVDGEWTPPATGEMGDYKSQLQSMLQEVQAEPEPEPEVDEVAEVLGAEEEPLAAAAEGLITTIGSTDGRMADLLVPSSEPPAAAAGGGGQAEGGGVEDAGEVKALALYHNVRPTKPPSACLPFPFASLHRRDVVSSFKTSLAQTQTVERCSRISKSDASPKL